MSDTILLQEIKSDFLISLGYTAENPPSMIDSKELEIGLGVADGTSAVWRSTGRHDLPYFKIGRRIRYRLNDVAKFILSRRRTSTAQEVE